MFLESTSCLRVKSLGDEFPSTKGTSCRERVVRGPFDAVPNLDVLSNSDFFFSLVIEAATSDINRSADHRPTAEPRPAAEPQRAKASIDGPAIRRRGFESQSKPGLVGFKNFVVCCGAPEPGQERVVWSE